MKDKTIQPRSPTISMVLSILLILILMTIQTIFSQQFMAGMIISVLISIGIAIWGYKRNELIHDSHVKLRTKLFNLLLGILGISIITVCYAGLSHHSIFTHLYMVAPIGFIIYTCVIAPILEEIIYRQTLYSEWLINRGSIVGAVLSGFMFVFIHLPGNVLSLMFYILSTTVIYIVYIRSGKDIRVTMLLHLMNNIIILL